MDFGQFVFWAFCGLLAFIGSGIIYVIWELKKSVDGLAVTVAVMIQKHDSLEDRVEKIEEKLSK
jgi:hypothetical protein